jgi:hypothetical protein
MPGLTKRERSIGEVYDELVRLWIKAPKKTTAELFDAHENMREQAKGLYDCADLALKKLVRVWKKNKRVPVDGEHYLDIEDTFRGQTKAFAPGFAHRYKLKLRKLIDD